ncbi:D-arabinono-1,4-lactone oxidase [Citricoccus sp. NPDC055426]|uniref:D-arabinono-1,4-lactone oxidase n=1 Tax=Citricoccus sp. NPDC055426 TaxID=3155536 RepID=UPI00342663E6
MEVARAEVPADESSVADAVVRAQAEGRQLRAVGTGYSWSEAVGAGAVLVRTDRLRGVNTADLAAGTAWIAAGTKLHEVCSALWAEGMELPTLGGFSGQTIAGAISTATHGSGRRAACLSAYVQAVRLVDAAGSAVVVDGKRPEALQAARVGLGLLGVMTEVEVQVRPATWLRIDDSWHAHFDPRWLSADDGIRRAVRWHPLGQDGSPGMRFQLREWVPVAEDSVGALPSPAALATGGWEEPQPFAVVEHALPLSGAAEAVEALTSALARESDALSGMPLALRVVAPDNAFLSPTQGEATMTISAAARSTSAGRGLFGLVHAALVSYGARPHWAKEHQYSSETLRDRYSKLSRFETVRQTFDPHGMFLTPAMSDVLAGATEDLA